MEYQGTIPVMLSSTLIEVLEETGLPKEQRDEIYNRIKKGWTDSSYFGDPELLKYVIEARRRVDELIDHQMQNRRQQTAHIETLSPYALVDKEKQTTLEVIEKLIADGKTKEEIMRFFNEECDNQLKYAATHFASPIPAQRIEEHRAHARQIINERFAQINLKEGNRYQSRLNNLGVKALKLTMEEYGLTPEEIEQNFAKIFDPEYNEFNPELEEYFNAASTRLESKVVPPSFTI